MNSTKSILITGANTGMGLATSIALAQDGHRIIMACRDERRGQAALEEVKAKSGSEHVELMLLDLGSLTNIREFAKHFQEKYDRLDVLINNAGLITVKRQVTEDGFEMMMGVNHLGHFLLTNLLLDSLKRSENGRIVVVSSGGYKWGKINFDDMNLEKNFSSFKGYGRSKLANILFTKELSNRLAETKVTVNCLHPGAVATSMGVNRDTGFGKGIHKILSPFFLSPLQGAQTAIYLATSSEVQNITGEYFYKKKVKKLNGPATDNNLAKQFWLWSEQQVGHHVSVI